MSGIGNIVGIAQQVIKQIQEQQGCDGAQGAQGGQCGQDPAQMFQQILQQMTQGG